MDSLASQVGRILLTTWLQRRNRHPLPTVVLVGVAVLFAALMITVLAFVHGIRSELDLFETFAAVVGMAGIGGVWILVVANVLEQNHPTLARLMPGQRHALRCALVAALLALTACAGCAAGLAFGSLPTGFAGVAVLLALCAVGVRWTWLWVPLNFAPALAAAAFDSSQRADSLAWLRGLCAEAPATAAAVVVAASAAFVASLIRSGGPRHERAHAQRERMRARAAGVKTAPSCALAGHWSQRPYAWWLERQLAQPRPVMARLLLGLGPTGHWTMHAAGVGAALVLGGIVAGIVALTPLAPALPSLAAGASFGVISGLVLPPLQACLRMRARRGEQVLLVLLPGAPRGADLNRALALRFAAHFGLAWLAAATLVLGALSLAEAVSPGLVDRSLGAWPQAALLGLLPLGLVLWSERWASMSAVASWKTALVIGIGATLADLVVTLHDRGGWSYAGIGGLYAFVTVAIGAWRWRVLSAEPRAWPVGRQSA